MEGKHPVFNLNLNEELEHIIPGIPEVREISDTRRIPEVRRTPGFTEILVTPGIPGMGERSQCLIGE